MLSQVGLDHSNGRKQRGTKEPLDYSERGKWKSQLETQHWKSKIMTSGAITSWQIEAEKMEAVTDFTFLGSNITADDGDCSHEIKRCLLLGRETKTNLDHILKSRHRFTDKDLYSQSCGFYSSHVWMWELGHKEGWVPKNCFFFGLWCWRRLLRAPRTARRSNLSISKEINPEYSWKDLY